MKRFLSIVTIIGMIGGASTFGCLADEGDPQNKGCTNNSGPMNQDPAPPLVPPQNPQNGNNVVLPPETFGQSANTGLSTPVNGEDCVFEKVDYVVVGVIAAVVAAVAAVIGYFCFKSDSKSSK